MGEPADAARYGGFAIGGMELALPMAALREVLPAGALDPMPCPARCVAGALTLRGVAVPVVDLRCLLDRPSASAADVVILMVHEGRMLGLLAERVTGVFQADRHGLHPVRAAVSVAEDGAGVVGAMLAGNVRRGDDGGVVHVLDPAALAALPQIPMVDDPEPNRQQHAGGGDAAGPQAPDADHKVPMMLVRCSRVALALDAMVVHATVADPRIERSVLSQGQCLGVIDYAGVLVPAVDLLSLTGLGRHDPEGARQAFVMQLPQGLVALMIGEVMDVIRALPADVIAVPAFALPQPGLIAGALPAAALGAEVEPQARTLAPQYLVVDGQALRTWPMLVALASTNTRRGAVTRPQPRSYAVAADASSSLRPMIIYELDGETATPIEEVVEILPFSADMATFGGTGPLLGMVALRGRMIPVMCLSGLVGLPPPAITPAVSVMVVESDGELVGFAVPRLSTIESADWEPELPTPREHRDDELSQVLHGRKLAQVGRGAQERMLRVLELRRLARALQQRAVAA